jgi:hypothetical protein
MSARFGWALLAALLLPTSGCAPMTFSHEAEIDFDAYPSVRVSVVNEPELSEYLAGELRGTSGFSQVTTDPAEPVSLVLTVSVAVTENVTVSSDGEIDYDYDATGIFSAVTPGGEPVLEGTEDDNSESWAEAEEDVLDEVARRFLPPYRI